MSAKPEDRQGLLAAAADESPVDASPDAENETASTLSHSLDMPEEVQQHLKTLLALDEKLLFIEQPLFWPSHGPLLIITSGAVIGLLIFAIIDFQSFLASGLIVVASAIALFGMTIWTIVSHKHLFYALTDKHVILGRGAHESTKFAYADITSVTREVNYLHFCRPEIAVRRKTRSPKPKVEFIDSIPNLDRAEQLLRARLPAAPAASVQDEAIN